MSRKTDKQTVYAEVTERIIAALEAGVAPWVKPWSTKEAEKYGAGAGIPHNASSGRPYSGINVIMLWLFGLPGRAGYMTFNQAEKLGGSVRKGSKGFRIVYADSHTKTVTGENGDPERETYWFLKRHTVFHVSQIDGLPRRYYDEAPALEYGELDDAAFNAWVSNTGADVKPGGAKASYMPAADVIGMPPVQSFETADAYKATLCHELGHWTGHKSRLARNGGTFAVAGHDYAREELVAEMCAAFCCARLGVEGKLQHAEYIGSWIRLLKSDDKAIFRAASAAQKACDYLFELQSRPLPRNRSLTSPAPRALVVKS